MQTYSDDREILFKIHALDTEMSQFLNSFDAFYISFHNCSPSYIQNLLRSHFIQSIRTVRILLYESISYTETFKQTLSALKRAGYDYMIYLQDDVFTFEPGPIEELTHLIKTADYKFLALEMNNEDLSIGDERLLDARGTTKLYGASSDDYAKNGHYAFDDGTYAGQLDYLISTVYPASYFDYPNIWDAEHQLNIYIKDHPIERYCTNYKTFRRYNIIGYNKSHIHFDIEKLRSRFGVHLQLF